MMHYILKGVLLSSVLWTGIMAADVVKSKKEVATKEVATKIVATKVVKEVVKEQVKSTGDIQIFTSDNSDGKITTKSIEAVFKKAGFFVHANRDMNLPFKKQFKSSGFDVYNLFTFFSKKETLALVKKYPNIGLFAPMSMSIYTKKGEKKISIASLKVEAMAKILKIPADDKILVKVGQMVQQALSQAMPKGSWDKVDYSVQEMREKRVSTYEMEMDAKEWEDEKEDFQMEFEGKLALNGFVIAGLNELNDDFDEAKYEDYDFYDVYSICKLPVIYTVAKIHPEAGAYAPCSLYIYKKKTEKKMHLAFPTVYNWISSMDIKDPASIKVLKEAQVSMEKILKELVE